ncbi:MAG: surface lipoprotein assembly modifier [Rhodospirillales bacterium]|nr:surface lipoprotein assembly modifier [Rhodospirillales bacterium]
MKIGPPLCILAVAACLGLTAPAGSAVNEPIAPSASEASAAAGIAEARALIRESRFSEALTVLRPLARGREVHADVLFHIGLAAVGESQRPGLADDRRDALLDEAIASFRVLLVDRPALVRVRLELARAFYLKGEDRLAKRNFEQVLAGKAPPPVVLNVNRFLTEIRARRRWDLHAGISLAPDTNIGAGSDERIIYINVGGARLPFTRDAEELTTSGIGLSVWTGGEYQSPLSERWRLRAGAAVSRREYSGNRFDQTFVSGHAGPRHLIGRDTEASALASVQRRWSGGAPNYDARGCRREAGRRFIPRLTGNVRASWHDRRYRTEVHFDGPVMDASLSGAWVVTPTVRADAGLGWGRQRTEVERWRHDYRWIRAGVSVALPKGFTVGGNAELRLTDYEGNWFPHTEGGEPREDRTRSFRASVYNRKLAWKGFSPQVSLVNEVRKTNAQLYDYERTGGELRFVKLF